MTLDVAALREQFPSLASGIAHFDGPGGTQTPAQVAEAVARTLSAPLSNRGTVARSEQNAEDAVAAFRTALADLLGASPAGIVYGRSATQLTYDFSRTLARTWKPGEEIVVSELDHDANIRPWLQAAEMAGARVRWLPLDPATAELDLTGLEGLINDRTRVVAITGASNLLGTKPPVAQVAHRAHEVGALVYVDGVHYAAHAAVDVGALGADFFVCSPYKFFGPHCAALAADPQLLATLHPDKLLPATDDVPERFELGTLPYELMAGATTAVDFIADLSPAPGSRRERIIAANQLIAEHEGQLQQRFEAGLGEISEHIQVRSLAGERTPTLFFTLATGDPAAAHEFLAARDILAPAGTFYAHEPFRALGLDVDSGLRVGLAPYNDTSEIDRLLNGLKDFFSAGGE